MKSFLLTLLVALLPLASGFAPSLTPPSFMGKTQLQMSSGGELKTGTVKWFNTIKGFGFILPDDGSQDIFVHQTVIKADGFRSLADGERVEYETEIDTTGRVRASRVTGPGGDNVQGAPFRPADDFGY